MHELNIQILYSTHSPIAHYLWNFVIIHIAATALKCATIQENKEVSCLRMRTVRP